MDNKTVAKYALGFIGGKPSVDRYYNEDETKSIDIMTCIGGHYDGGNTAATIGLYNTDIGMTSDEKKIRVELMMTGLEDVDIMGNVISTIAFDVMDRKNCRYGAVISNAIGMYVDEARAKHVVLMSPVLWDKYNLLPCDDMNIVWLLAIPITDKEKTYIEEKGIAAFDALMEEKQIDIKDVYRYSIV